MDDFGAYIGRVTGRATVVVERGPVTNFARAVRCVDPIHRDAEAARAAGFADIPAPPTFGFAAQYWGRWDELQPSDPTPDGNPVVEIMGALMAGGGLVLHGEQEFRYHRPLVVGQRLSVEGVVRDVYRKSSGERTMTFLVVEDTYRDADGEPVLTSTMNLLHRS